MAFISTGPWPASTFPVNVLKTPFVSYFTSQKVSQQQASTNNNTVVSDEDKNLAEEKKGEANKYFQG